MNRIKILFQLIIAGVFVLLGCKSTQPAVSDFDEIRNLDTLVVSASKEPDYEEYENELPIYRSSHLRTIDLLHTSLDLKFDWENEKVIGKASLDFTPYSRSVDKIELDAKNFDIESISQKDVGPLEFDYDEEQIVIHLTKAYNQGEELNIEIEYVANPTVGADGGSAAITSDQGLFFINPSGENPFKPKQIWTQGETEWNSRWFPTVDKPNERCTQEIRLTVEEELVTLSNGLLQSSLVNDDGTRTDIWRLDIPHAPYLFMLAIGDFAVVKDKWKEIPVEYYVEPKFEKDARQIFPHTLEMLDYFSETLSMEYPWPKYSQVVVRDYVSGAMENTTGVIFGEFMQDDARALVDNLFSEQIVAHEMIHHWFGDWVTCESWANLTMNEGFANYGEYLWLEHKHGRETADFVRLQEMQGYLQSVLFEGKRSIIDFEFEDKEDMFDAHSYNKGGLILHMLRRYVGDTLFFKALNKYLNDNALSSVEAHDLRLAFESVTGEDMNWFFNQWFFSSGHPQLSVSKSFSDGNLLLAVQQTQEGPNVPQIFILPTNVKVMYADGSSETHTFKIDKRVQSFRLKLDQEPAAIIFDSTDDLLAEIDFDQDISELQHIYKNDDVFIHQYQAFGEIIQKPDQDILSYLELALQNKSWVIRYLGLTALDQIPAEVNLRFQDAIVNLAQNDSHSQVKGLALEMIGNMGWSSFQNVLEDAINVSAPFEVSRAGLKSLSEFDKAQTAKECLELESIGHSGILYRCSQVFLEQDDAASMTYLRNHISDIQGIGSRDYFEAFYKRSLSIDQGSSAVEALYEIAANKFEDLDRRAGAYAVVKDYGDKDLFVELRRKIEENTNPDVLNDIINAY